MPRRADRHHALRKAVRPVAASQAIGYGELLRRIEHGHRAVAGACRGRLVRHDQALYPVRLRDPSDGR